MTPYLDVQHLTKSFGALTLFRDISFSIGEGQKVGLIAKNGTGKSTLLSILCGKEGYGDPEKVLKAKQILTKLKISNLEQPMGQLSGGQQKRVALANVLLTEPDLIILDEPTNHLDLEMIEWLEGFLQRGNRTLLMVTHDRFFLDRVCTVILELDDQTIYTYRTELEWMRRMPQARGHKARYREEAFYELEKVAKQRLEERQLRLKSSNVYIGSKIFECQYISKRYETSPDPSCVGGETDASPKQGRISGVVILKDFYYNFSRFEKMGIVGNNGTGKSTFIKMLLGEVPVDEGRIVIGDTVRFGYFSQEGLQFNENQKVIDIVRDIAEYVELGGGKKLSASQLLQYFLFTNEQQYNYVYKLSGGERRKLYLCTVLMRNPNFLVLDEPTNDLDIVTLQILEEYLQDFPGCVIVVSHDRYFMDKVVDHLLVFKGNGEIKDFPGNYTQYREWASLEDSKESKSSSDSSNSRESAKSSYRHDDRRRLSYKEKREMEQLEKDIAALEAEKKHIEEALCGGTTSVDEITAMSKRLPVLNDELDEKSMRWLELSEIER